MAVTTINSLPLKKKKKKGKCGSKETLQASLPFSLELSRDVVFDDISECPEDKIITANNRQRFCPFLLQSSACSSGKFSRRLTSFHAVEHDDKFIHPLLRFSISKPLGLE